MRALRRRFSAIVALYLVAVIVVAVLIDRLGDVWWPATALMFAPRWIWGVPLAVLVPLALPRERWPLLPALAAAALVLLGPILDLRLPIHRGDSRAARDVRVMTYNVGGAVIDHAALEALVADSGADLVALQEHGYPSAFPRMNFRCAHGTCLASRHPIIRMDRRDPADLLAQHGAGSIHRYEVRLPQGMISVTSLHLATVRDGIAAIMKSPWRGAPVLTERTRERALEAELARAWTERSTLPTIVAGDFNTPVESAIYRRTWSGFTNAFGVAGLGFGASKHTRWHGVRIDHILVGPGWEVLRSWVGPGLGGDHRPVFADLRFSAPAP